MTLGNKLKLLRTEKNLSPREVAFRLDLNLYALLEWEEDKSTPDIIQLKQISDFYHISIEYLIDNEISDLHTKKTKDSNPSFFQKIIRKFIK